MLTKTMFKSVKIFLLAFLVVITGWLMMVPVVLAGGIEAQTAWARASIGIKRPGVVFVTIVNRGDKGDVLTGVETPVAGKARVHRSVVSNGVASMTMAGPVQIPANGQVQLAPGGLHIMLMKLNQPLVKGESFSLTLVFEKAGPVEVVVPVLSFGSAGPKN